jgi:hypothetical protein
MALVGRGQPKGRELSRAGVVSARVVFVIRVCDVLDV